MSLGVKELWSSYSSLVFSFSPYLLFCLFLCPRMRLIINLHQPLDPHLSIFLGCGQACVSKHLLYCPQINPCIHKMGGKCMSQGVGSWFLCNITLQGVLFHEPLNSPGINPFSSCPKKNRLIPLF